MRKLLPILFVFFLLIEGSAQSFTSIWDTTESGISGTNEITIPTNPLFIYNYTVDWGDGTSDTGIIGDFTHTYTVPGQYTVQISGDFPAIYFNNAGDRRKILEILGWGSIAWQSMEDAFHGCENLNFDAIDSPNLSGATSLRNTFRRCTSFNGILNNWNVSTITDLSGTFADASIFNRPLDLWTTASITDMSFTFQNARLFNEPLDNWNTALVTTMESMFNGANSFNQNIDNWNVGNVTDMNGMLQSTNQFNQPLNSWNVSNVTDMSDMLQSSAFNQPLDNWNVSKVTDMASMFAGNRAFNQNINNWVVDAVTDMSSMFFRATDFNQPLNLWNVDNVTDMRQMFDGFILVMDFNQNLNDWNVSKVEDMEEMFRDCRTFNQPLNNWDVSAVTDMARMFDNAQAFNQDISGWNVSAVTDMAAMFQRTTTFDQSVNSWNVSNVTNMSLIFSQSVFNSPLDLWNVSNVQNFSSAFLLNTNFNQDITGWNINQATNLQRMFSGAVLFNQDLVSWNIENVTNMADMLNNSGLSQENYDNLLIGWAAQDVQNDINLGATNLTYCDGRDARDELINDHSWSFTGDSVNCTFVLCTTITSPMDTDTMVPANSDIRWAQAPNATGYRITLEVERGGVRDFVIFGGNVANNLDVGNVVGLDFTNEFIAGDIVFITVVPYNADGPATGCPEISFTVIDSWVNSPDAFKLTYDTNIQFVGFTTPINQLLLQTRNGFTYNFSIDWGDGQYNNNVTDDITHTYLAPGIYTVSIIGDFPAPRHEEVNSDGVKLLTIDQWGTYPWQSMQGAFAGCNNMEYNATDIPDLSNVTDMSRMFIACRNFNGDINNWDVSNVNTMFGAFGAATIYNQPLNNWNVSNVTNMSFMFASTNEFNQNINTWNTQNVTNMSRMFENTMVFDQPLNDWNVSAVTDMSDMFERSLAFDQPLDNWDVDNVENMDQMFESATAFNQNIDNWNVGRVRTMVSMFERAEVFNQPLNSWDVSEVELMESMFQQATAFNQTLGNWDVEAVVSMESMFDRATVFNQNIDTWNVTNVLTMRAMFAGAAQFNQPLNSWDVNSVVNMDSMFSSAEAFNQPINNWDVSAVASMAFMFANALAFDQPLDNWNVSSVTLMPGMFQGASVFNQDINGWNVAVVTNMQSMFKNALAFNSSLGNWDTGEVLTMQEMFSGAATFNQNIDAWNVSFVTTMQEMFRDAASYNQDMDSWNVASVTTMQGMFQGATMFNGLLSSWNVRAVNTMEHMFDGASAFNQDINNWRVTGVQNMNFMFRNATVFNQALHQWNLGNVSMQSMFQDAFVFNQDLSEWNVSGVSDMQNMLDNTALTRENYDNTLIAWSEQNLTPGITLGAENLPYCDAVEERQSMIDNFGWSIQQDVLDCPVPECTQLVSPLNGDIDVPVNTNLTWEPTLFARGYRLEILVQPGNIMINETINNDTFYEFPADFTGGETVSVRIIPFNDEGDAVGPCILESFTVSNDPATVPDCSVLTAPLNGAIDIAVETDLSWEPITNADGYRITVGSSIGGNDILNDVDAGNVTTFDLPADLPENSEIFVTIIPYNTEGDANCTEERFTTEFIPVPPGCSALANPISGTTNVPVDTDLSWMAVSNATGYLVSVGTTSNGIEVANSIDVGNVTTYNFPTDLQADRNHFVTIVPYNDEGDAMGCSEEVFRTGTTVSDVPPLCTALSTPVNGAVNVALDTDLSWNPTGNVDGYRITVGTVSGGNNIIDNLDVGNVITFDLPADLPENTEIFVTIVPYNAFGDATGCIEESFRTIDNLIDPPSCTTLSAPLNTAINVQVDLGQIRWNGVANADDYLVSINGSLSDLNDETNLVVTGTSHPFSSFFTSGETVFVTIVPRIGGVEAMNCVQESFTIEGTTNLAPECTNLSIPLNLDIDVPVTTNISWDPAQNATGYRVQIGTQPGQGDLFNQDVGNTTLLDLPNDLPSNTEIFVFIQPYNGTVDAEFCEEESFITSFAPDLPICTSLLSPEQGRTEVALNTGFSWGAVGGIDGYFVSIGTDTGGNDILGPLDVGLTTSYQPENDLPAGIEVYVTITPFNADGNAIDCESTSFSTVGETEDSISSLFGFSPDGDGINDFWAINGIENYPNNTVTIYNRWGDAIFKINGYDNASNVFTGEANQLTGLGAGQLPEGTYFFTITVPENHNLNATQGYVVLKR